MSAFSTYSPSYENISNRMCRLKQNKSAQNITQIRPNSARKVDFNPYSTGIREFSPYQPRGRLSPSGQALFDHQFASTEQKFAGRVTKNTGIKKYNQRQLKDIGEGRAAVHLKTEGNVDKGNVLYSIENWAKPIPTESKKEIQVAIVEPARQGSKFDCNLIPGRIYRREALAFFMS